jgi:hypothetical protein
MLLVKLECAVYCIALKSGRQVVQFTMAKEATSVFSIFRVIWLLLSTEFGR